MRRQPMHYEPPTGEVLEEAGVMECSDTRLWFSFTRLKELIKDLADDKEAFVEFFGRVYDKVGRCEAWESRFTLFSRPAWRA